MGDLVGPKVPESKFIEGFRKNLDASKSAFAAWRERAKTYYRTYAGDPWDPDAKALMERQERPPVAYNYTLAVVNTVLGKEMAERKEIEFRGVGARDMRDQKVAEWQTNLVRTWWQQNDGYKHEAQALLDQLITGYGWGHVFVDMSRFPFKPRLEHVEAMEMYPDPRAKDDNLADARWIIREREWPIEDVEAMWPERVDELRAAESRGARSSAAPRVVYSNYEGPTMVAPEEETVRVWEYQFRKKERWVAFVEPTTGERGELPQSDFDSISEDLGAQGQQIPESYPFLRDVYYRAILSGSDKISPLILQKPERMATDQFTYTCITGFREKSERRTEFFGLVRLVHEPQLWSAKVHSTIIEIMARSSKNTTWFEAGAIIDPRKAKEARSKPGGFVEVSDGAITQGKIHFEQAASFPYGFDAIIQQAINGIHQITGVSEFMMGTSTRERSNLLISNYQEQSSVLLSPLTEPLSGFRIRIGKLLASMIQMYVPAEDIDRMIEDEGIEGLTIEMTPDPQTGQMVQQQIATPAQYLKATDLMDFDVVVDIGTASASERQHIWQLFSQHGLLKFMSEAGIPMHHLFPYLLRMLPIQSEVAMDIGDKMEKEMTQQQEMQTAEGMVEAFQGLDPQTMQQVVQQLMQIVQQQQTQQPQQQQPPGGPIQ